MEPRKITVVAHTMLHILWNDGHNGEISLKNLRDHCPCADCQGESVLWRTYKPTPKPDTPGKYVVQGITPVGKYGVQFFWGDGHSAGIFTWEMLRELCECPLCRKG